MTGGLGDCHVHRARWRIDPLGLLAVRIATPVGRSLIALRAQKAFTLDAHRHLEGAREHRRNPFGAVFDQLFQNCLL